MPVFTYLANTIRKGDRQIPYSLITATDLDALPASLRASRHATIAPPIGGRCHRAQRMGGARARGVAGDRIDVDYYLWDPTAGLTTKTARSRCRRGSDRGPRRRSPPCARLSRHHRCEEPCRLGSAVSDRSLPRPSRWTSAIGTTIARRRKRSFAFERGRDLWRSRYGSADLDPLSRAPAARTVETLSHGTRRRPARDAVAASHGRRAVPRAAAALEASRGRHRLRRVLHLLQLLPRGLGAAAGGSVLPAGHRAAAASDRHPARAGLPMPVHLAAAALRSARPCALRQRCSAWPARSLYGHLIVLRPAHVVARRRRAPRCSSCMSRPLSLALGALGGVIAAVVCVIVSLRAVARVSPRALLTASLSTVESSGMTPAGAAAWLRPPAALPGSRCSRRLPRRRRRPACSSVRGSAARRLAALLAGWLRVATRDRFRAAGTWAVWRLGFRSAAFRPSRSVLSAALIASAAFIIVSVGCFPA